MIGASALLPAAAVAATTVAGQAIDLLSHGSSFANLLAKPAETALRPPHLTGEDATSSLSTQRGEIARLEALRQNARNLESQLCQQLVAQLDAEGGIDLSEPIVLGVHANGQILELSGHRDRAQIEQLFENNPQLGGQVRQLLQHVEQIRRSGVSPITDHEPQLVIDQSRDIFTVV